MICCCFHTCLGRHLHSFSAALARAFGGGLATLCEADLLLQLVVAQLLLQLALLCRWLCGIFASHSCHGRKCSGALTGNTACNSRLCWLSMQAGGTFPH